MAIQEFQLQQVLEQQKAAKNNEFWTQLMTKGMASGGDFEDINDKPSYIPGPVLPNKTALWNQYLQLKGHKLTAQDVAEFESNYQQVVNLGNEKQIREIGKLNLKGYSTKEIQDVVKSDAGLYENMLDLVTDMKASGDPNKVEQALALQTFLPTDEESMFDNPYAAPLAIGTGLAAATYGNKYMQTRIGMDDAKDKWSKDRKPIRDKITTQKQLLDDTKKDIKTKSEQIKKKAKSLKLGHKSPSKPLKALKKERADLNKTSKTLTNEVNDLKTKYRGVKFNKPPTRYQRLGKNITGGTAQTAAYLFANPIAGSIGQGLGGDEGRAIAEDYTNTGLMSALTAQGMYNAGKGMTTKGPWKAKVAGGILMATAGGIGLYNKYLGNEE
tara:strand:- start:1542 stop:2693 length:1152 start_codon:yes stop_codon:yes gene_type:complete